VTNTNLSNFKFNDLLPSSVKDAAKFKAASECLDKLFDRFDERVRMMLIYSRIDELNNQQLDDLAWQWNIGYYEGYSFAQTLEDKRALIKHAIQLHWHKGTKWALESVPIFLGMPAFTVEWFESDLLGTYMNPYEFDIAIDTSVRGASDTLHHEIRELINNLKNVRSYLRHVILMMSWKVTAHFGLTSQNVKAGKVLPLLWKGDTTKIKYGQAVVGNSVITGRVNPKSWPGSEVTVKNYRIIGGYSAISGRVNPKHWAGDNTAIQYRRGVYGGSVVSNRILPKSWSGENVTIPLGRAVGGYSATISTARPKRLKGVKFSVKNNRMIGCYGANIGTVYPLIP